MDRVAERDRESSPAEPRRSTPDRSAGDRFDGRRPSSVGRALIVILLTLALGLLLDAQGLHKSAFSQGAGWRRTTALALTGPLADTSHWLYLDRPRQWVKDALGRSQDDTIDTVVALPPPPKAVVITPVTSSPGQPPSPVKRAFSPSHPLRFWIAGDSLGITPGYSLLRATAGSKVFESVGGIDGQVATGLERPDAFNWFVEVKKQLHAAKRDVVIFSFGANDDKAYMTGLPSGVSIGAFGDAAWTREYRRRVLGLIDLANRAGAYVIWLGLPTTDDPSQTDRFDRINAVVAQAIRRRPGHATYVDEQALLAGPDGGYAEYLTTPSGETEDVREPDGIHLAPAGGDIVARQILKDLNQTFDLTSWRHTKARVAHGGG